MRTLVVILFALLASAGTVLATVNNGSVGPGQGIVLRSSNANPCPPASLCLNFDGGAENGYCWQYGGIARPYYGAFAECCDFGAPTPCPSGDACICGIELLLTGIGNPCVPLDAYVWDDAAGVPGNVLSMTPGFNPCPVATWPEISTHDLDITDTSVQGFAWFGYWADYSSQACGYLVAADTNGFGGCPYTNIAPGIGYPTGWNNVSIVWGPTQAIGIGAWFTCGPCPSVPAREATWGQIKSLYN